MKKIITFKSSNGKECVARVSINSFKELSLDYILIDFSFFYIYDIKTERRESILLQYIDKHCGSSLNEIFEIKN